MALPAPYSPTVIVVGTTMAYVARTADSSSARGALVAAPRTEWHPTWTRRRKKKSRGLSRSPVTRACESAVMERSASAFEVWHFGEYATHALAPCAAQLRKIGVVLLEAVPEICSQAILPVAQ